MVMFNVLFVLSNVLKQKEIGIFYSPFYPPVSSSPSHPRPPLTILLVIFLLFFLLSPRRPPGLLPILFTVFLTERLLVGQSHHGSHTTSVRLSDPMGAYPGVAAAAWSL